MKLFLAGLATAFVGFVAWFALSVLFGVAAGVGVENEDSAIAWLIFPFLLMVGGPFVFWFMVSVTRLLVKTSWGVWSGRSARLAGVSFRRPFWTEALVGGSGVLPEARCGSTCLPDCVLL